MEYSFAVRKWTWEEIKIVKKLAEQGLAARQIAQQFPGRSRNSVIGLCARQNIVLMAKRKDAGKTPPNFKSPNKSPHKTRVAAIKKIIAEKKIEVDQQVNFFDTVEEGFEPKNKTLLQLGSYECKAIMGPVKGLETKYCAHKTVEGESWCDHHFKLYTVPSHPRRRDYESKRA